MEDSQESWIQQFSQYFDESVHERGGRFEKRKNLKSKEKKDPIGFNRRRRRSNSSTFLELINHLESEESSKNSLNSSISCDNEPSHSAIYYCEVCHLNFCNECFTIAHAPRVFSNHQRTKITDSSQNEDDYEKSLSRLLERIEIASEKLEDQIETTRSAASTFRLDGPSHQKIAVVIAKKFDRKMKNVMGDLTEFVTYVEQLMNGMKENEEEKLKEVRMLKEEISRILNGGIMMRDVLILILLAFLAQFVFRSLLTLDINKRVYNHRPGPCRKIEGVVNGSEDITVVPEKNLAFITSGLVFLHTDETKIENTGDIFIYDLSQKSYKAEKVPVLGLEDAQFLPHGISHWVLENGTVRLFLVVHSKNFQHSIVILDYDEEKKQLNHARNLSRAREKDGHPGNLSSDIGEIYRVGKNVGNANAYHENVNCKGSEILPKQNNQVEKVQDYCSDLKRKV
ncbi:hypothetical protein L5515_006455 [Caenorhabditis briggsae]|uniref:B box-type domain-containing protein n=1 Tax=Caenorhabditis briggsae TaxID=6238 RepID=A0AAE9JK16_CAEBR|nr:hypothetical protein L5515_006455 [Caenorhabditis briggsae]